MASNKARVLVVDDDATAREGLDRLLRIGGFDVAAAADAREALELAARTAPDIVVTDLRMPGMGGVELLLALRARGCDSPVIVATACDEVAPAVAAIRAGATDYLTKPIDADALFLAIDRALATRDLRRDAAALRKRSRRGPLDVITLAAEPVTAPESRLEPDVAGKLQVI